MDMKVVNTQFYLIMFDLGSSQTSLSIGAQPLIEVSNGHLVEVNVQLLLQLVEILLLRLG